MKDILVISPTFPYPSDAGAKIRIYNTIKELSKNHRINLMSMTTDNVENSHISHMNSFCDDIYVYKIKSNRYIPSIKTLLTKKPYRVNKFLNKEFAKIINEELKENNYDIIWCNFFNMAVYLKDSYIRNSYVILDQHNADEIFWQSYVDSKNIVHKFLAKKNIINLRGFREKHIDKFDLILSVSKQDKEFTEKWLSSDIDVSMVPNGVDISYYNNENKVGVKEKNIIFCGSMDVTMNIEAVKDFVKHVFPKVKREIPGVKFWVVGRNPVESIRNLSNDSIIVTGTVDDVRPYYEKAKISVAPFEFGGGTKLKVTESLAMGVPMVATSIGAQGIDVVDEEHILVRDDWDEFAKGIIELFNCREKYNKLLLQGRKFVEENYSWKGIIKNLQEEYEEVFF